MRTTDLIKKVFYEIDVYFINLCCSGQIVTIQILVSRLLLCREPNTWQPLSYLNTDDDSDVGEVENKEMHT